MPYGTDVTVFVEDQAGDLGGAPSPAPWWVSPDVDIPAHSGQAEQGVNQVRIRVHAHEEPILEELIAAEVYVGQPSLVMSPAANTVRIDPGTLRFRPANLPGTEPIASTAGGTLTFPWTPSSGGPIDGPGHRCLVLRAFPVSVTPPTSPFDVPNEQHEAQHNIEILSTNEESGSMKQGGAGTPEDPRRRDEETGMWWEDLMTMAVGRTRGRRFVAWAFDPDPSRELVNGIRKGLKRAGVRGFSKEPPGAASLDVVGTRGEQIDPAKLTKNRRFARLSGIGTGLFAPERLIAAADLDLGPRKPSHLVLRFDHSNLRKRSAVVLHCAQWDASGRPEGGMTIVAVAPAS